MRRTPHSRYLQRFVVLALASAAAHTANAQSFVGDTFSWNVSGIAIASESGAATVANGNEFRFGSSNVFFDVDVDATSITITADFGPSVVNPATWGITDIPGVGNDTRVATLRITGLEFDNAQDLAEFALTTTTNAERADITIADNAVAIGDTPDQTFEWSDGDTLRIELFTRGCNAGLVLNTTRNTTHDTLADAIDAANRGDTLELGPCNFFERDLLLFDKDLTIRGQGPGVTVIDAAGLPGTIFTFGLEDASTIEGLTIQNATGDPSSAVALVTTSDPSPTFRNVHFITNDAGSGSSPIITLLNGSIHFDRCVFAGNTVPTNRDASVLVAVGNNTTLTAVNTVFYGGSGRRFIDLASVSGTTNARFVNCTFADAPGRAHLRASDANTTVELVNCVLDDSANATAVEIFNGASVTATRSVYPGATGDNIDGAPTFADPAGDNYRLAPGSSGIDVANADLYFAAGGGPLDAAGGSRGNNDAGVADTGTGTFAFLDAGALEFQDNTLVTLDADFNMDLSVDAFDITDLLNAIDEFLSP